jgi:uncharacterized repeat protein (TIGR01451 family)
MKRFIPRSSYSNLRAFNACLLSFLLLMTPLATLAASMKPAAPRPVDSTATKAQPADDAAKPQLATPQSETKSQDLQPSSSTGLFNLLAQPLPPSITATKQDAFTDADGDGKADIGQTINYTTVISNIGGTSSATGVVFTDTPDANTTLTGTVNTSPIALDQTVTLNEDTPTAITLTGIDPDNNALTYTVVGNPTNGGLTGTAPNLTYTPNANFNGSDTITFKVNDGTVDSNQLGTISITVTAVNDPPTFTQSGGNQTTTEDSGLQTVNGFITAISPGPANESGQTVSFVITNNSNPGIFSSGPAISPTGVLTYTPALNENGTATITYKAQDNGGTANGGDDDSPTQSFTITINAQNDAPVAVAKAFTAQANMKINLTGLLTGATDPNDTIGDQDVGYVPTFTLTNITAAATPCSSPVCTAPQIAAIGITNLSNTNNGSFDFNPPPGYTGTVNLLYTITDSGNPGPGVQSAPQTITITVQGPVVWFVDPNAASNGDGRLTSPFKFLSNNAGASNDADDVDAANHRIFLYTGAATGGFTLNASEWLVGQGATNSPSTFDDLMGFVPPAGTYPRPSIGGTRPTITSASSGVTLGSDNRLFGLSFTDTAGTAINGSGINVGTLLLKDIDIVNDISASGAGIFLSGGGTATLTGTNNFINTTSATALFVANTNIGAANLNFVSIKAGNANAFPDPSEGIVLNSTGASGGLIVTGNSAGQCGGNVNTGTDPFTITAPNTADCTGGEIQGTTGNGISLTNTRNVSLTRMWIHTTGLSGIDGTTTTNFTFANGLIEKSGLNDALTPVTATADVSNIAFNDVSSGVTNLSGTVSITRSTLRNAFYHGINIYNENGTISDLVIGGSGAGNAINSTTSTASSKGSGIKIIANGAAASASVVTKATVAHNSILNYPSDSGVKILGGNAAFGPQSVLGNPGDATNIFSITNNDVRGPNSATPMGSNAIETGMSGTGRAKFSITNNGTATTPLQHFKGIGITSGGGNRAQLVAIVTNNFINGGDNIFSSRGMAIGAQVGYPTDTISNGTVNASITNNTVNQSAGQGIFAALTNSNISGNILIQNNTVGAPRDASTPGMRIESGSSSGNTNLCLNLSNNNTTGNAAPGIGVRKQGTNAAVNVFGIVGLSPSPANPNQTEDYIGTQNPSSSTGPVGFSNDGARAVKAIVHSGSNFVSCTQPVISSIQNQFETRDVLAQLDNAFQNGNLDSLLAPVNTEGDYASIFDELNGIRKPAPAQPAVDDSRSAQVTAKAESTVENNASVKLASFVQTSALVNMTGVQSNTASVKQTAHAINAEARTWSDITPAASRRATRAASEAKASNVGNTDASFYKASFVKASYEPAAGKTVGALARTESDKYSNLSHARTTRTTKQPAHKATAANSALAAMPAVGVVRVDGSGNGSGSGFTLPAGKSVTVRFSVTVNSGLAAGVTQVSNQGQVAGTNFGTVLTDDPDTGVAGDATVTLIARADLALTSKTDGVTTVNPGSDLTYTINYANHGRAASNAVLTETVPTGTVFKSAGSSAGWSCADGSPAGTTCTLTIGAVPSTGIGSTGSKTFVVTVINPAAAGLNTISNTASIADTVVYEPDITPADNSATDNNTALNAAPDLTVSSKTDGVTNTTPGSTLTYTINYANTGNQGAANVVLTETVPTGTTYVAAGSSAWSCANGSPGGTTCTLTIGTLNGGGAGSSATFIVTVNSPAAAGLANIVNTASIDDDHANGADATPANNSKTDTDILDAAPDLTLSKSPDVSTIAPGQPIVYTLSYANVGNQTAANVVITETVPANTTFTTAGSSAGWSCPNGSPGGTTCTLSLGTVAAGTNGTRTFAVTVVDPVPGGTTQVTNTATIADDGANGADPTPANNSTGNVTIGVCLNPAVVTNTNDSGAGSLRQSLVDVCDGGTITFNLGAGPHTITALSTLVIAKNVTITNTLSGTNGPVTVTANSGSSNAFRVDSPVTTASISGLTVTGANATGISGGGLLAQSGTVTLTNMLFTGNTVINGAGGALAVTSGATLNVRNTTVSGNSATFGGGIYNNGGTLNLLNVTVTNNLASGNVGGGPVGGPGAVGGGIETGAGIATNIKNSIVAGNSATSSINVSGTITDQGNNILTGDPRLAALANNGGLTQTHALLIDSPALDGGDNTAATAAGLTTDQRGAGFNRILDSADVNTTQTVDIGAYEADPTVEDISDKTTAEDTPLPQFSFNVGDAATAFDSIAAVATTNPTLVATITVGPGADSSKRTLDITPAANQTGTATITVTVTKTVSGTTLSMSDTFVLTVTEVNDAPTASNDAIASVAEDSGVYTITIASLLLNDSTGPANESGQTLTLAAVSNPVGGTVSNDATNVYFTPAADFNGPASFQYTVTDNGTTNGAADPQTSAPGTVSFTITEVNDAPSAANDSLSSIAEDSGVRTIPFTDLTGNDSKGPANESGQALIVKTVSNPVGGTVQIVGTDVQFTPTADFNGAASFDYTVEDNGTTNGVADPLTSATAATVSFTITEVNDAPSAANDSLSSIAEDSGVRTIPFTDLTGNDSTGPANESGQTLIVKTVSNPIGGTVQIVGTDVQFTPAADYNGSASFDYTVEDNGTTNGAADPLTSSGPATVTFTITEVNDKPTPSNDSLTNVAEDSGVRTIPFATLTGNDSTGPADENTQTLIVKTVSNPVGGTVQIVGTDVQFTPTADFNGAASFDYTVEDNGTTNGVADPQTSATTATVSFTIDAVNDAPSFTKGPDQTASGFSPQTVPNWATNISAGPPDEVGQTVNFIVSNNNNALFTVQPAIDPSGTLTYTPVFGANGTAIVTVELHDNGGTAMGGQDTSAQQTFNLTVNPIGWTTTGDSGVTEDESNPAKPTYTNFTAGANAGSPAGTYTLRYNITAAGNLTATGANTRLRVRFRDEGAGSRVIVAIMRSNITGGVATMGTLFDSDTFTPNSGFQMQELIMPPITFDFTQNFYWLEVIMTKDTTTNQPGFGAAQINQQ